MGLYSWLLAQAYDLAIHKTEQRCLQRWRQELLASATGELLEIGAGTGLNLPHYPAQLKKLTLSEPDRQMRKQLHKKLVKHTTHPVEITDWSAEKIALPDQSVDTIISTLVLCSVDCAQTTLQELYRVLRPGGQLLFIEHIIAADSKTVRWQKLCEPLWRCSCGNCHLTRDTIYSIEKNGMIIEQLIEDEIIGAPTIARRAMRGRAIKPFPTVL